VHTGIGTQVAIIEPDGATIRVLPQWSRPYASCYRRPVNAPPGLGAFVPVRRTAALLLTALAFATLPASHATADNGATARARLAAVASRVQDAEAREGVLADRIKALDRRLAATERELDAIRQRYGARASAAYQTGMGTDPIAVMMSSPDPASVVERLDLLAAASRSDDDLLRRGAALRRTLRGQRREAAAAHKEVDAVRRSLAADSAELRALLTRLAAADAARLRALPRASRAARLTGRYACLVGPTHAYSSTWGAPRSGGRTHQGTDVFAPMGSPAYAVIDGVIRRESTSSNGGLQVYLRGSDGNEYFYAHMSAYVARPGQHVTAGQEIAKVGDTGNARGGPPHVHFEVHPGGGAPVDPYPYVRRFCP
jgi:murein DD-endopeptidase MepM/ murein hydrolase activator NlpD